MLKITDLSGLWTRSLQVWADGRRDVSTKVAWLQGPGIYADLRQPPDIAGHLFHARCLHELNLSDCEKLSSQQGFSGIFTARDGYFEWTRQLDYQPAQGQIDAGRLYWQNDILVEEGLRNEHFEHWHRNPRLPLTPCWGYVLQGAGDGIRGNLLRVGNLFMYSRGRAAPLAGGTLRDAVSAAANVNAARALIDCEISFGTVAPDGWQITASTLPYRKNAAFNFRLQSHAGLVNDDIAPDGKKITRAWQITMAQGNPAET